MPSVRETARDNRGPLPLSSDRNRFALRPIAKCHRGDRNAGPRAGRSLAATQTYALEGGCFVVAPSAVTSTSMASQICDTPAKHAQFTVGGRHWVIYGPHGNPISARMP